MTVCVSIYRLSCVPKYRMGVKQGEATPTAGRRKAELEERQDPQDLTNVFQKLCPNGC